MKRKLLFILDTFYPEYASTGQLMTELCQHLQEDYDITVIVGIPKYGIEMDEKYLKGTFHFEKFENINIVRVRTPQVNKTSKVSRLLYMVGHFINALRATFKVDRPDLIYVISQPPIVGGYLGRLTKLLRGGKLIYNIQDFNPEQIEAVGYNKFQFINNIARWLDNRTIKKSDKVIVVGRDMAHTLTGRHKNFNEDKLTIINNWIHEDQVRPCEMTCDRECNKYIEKYNTSDKFTIMYSGNIGLYYDLENIIKVIADFKNYKDLQFVFVGDGAQRKNLETYCKSNELSNVKFYDYVSKDEVQCSLNAADVHFVTNQKGIKGVSVPSKIYGVLAVGKAVLGVLEEESEAQMIIKDSKCGRSVEPQDYKGIKELIQWFYDNKEEARNMGTNGRNYLDENLKMINSLDKYKEIIGNVLKDNGGYAYGE